MGAAGPSIGPPTTQNGLPAGATLAGCAPARRTHMRDDKTQSRKQSPRGAKRKQQKEDPETGQKVGAPRQPPAHLPDALPPGGAAENAFRAAAQNQEVDHFLLRAMEEGLERIRRHRSLNCPEADESPQAM